MVRLGARSSRTKLAAHEVVKAVVVRLFGTVGIVFVVLQSPGAFKFSLAVVLSLRSLFISGFLI